MRGVGIGLVRTRTWRIPNGACTDARMLVSAFTAPLQRLRRRRWHYKNGWPLKHASGAALRTLAACWLASWLACAVKVGLLVPVIHMCVEKL
jgi:hypothetical protein